MRLHVRQCRIPALAAGGSFSHVLIPYVGGGGRGIPYGGG